MKTFNKIIFVLIIFAMALSISLFLTHIIVSIGKLYEINYITNLSFLQIYGILGVVSLVKYTYTKPNGDIKFDGEYVKSVIKQYLTYFFMYLIVWGVMVLFYNIIK